MVRSSIILIFILLFSIIPVSAEITNGACTDVLIAVGATCTATGFRDAGSGNTQTVWKVDDVDASVTPRQALMQVAPYWLPAGNFRPVGGQVTQQGTYFRYTNPSDSNDFVEIFISSVFQGGDFSGVQTGSANYQQTSYVSTSGSDAANGNSTSTAWASWKKAASVVQDGEDVIILSGTYTDTSDVRYFNGGLSNAPVIYKGQGNASTIYDFGGDHTYVKVDTNGFVNLPYIQVHDIKLQDATCYISTYDNHLLYNMIISNPVTADCGGFTPRGVYMNGVNSEVYNIDIMSTYAGNYGIIMNNAGNIGEIHNNIINNVIATGSGYLDNNVMTQSGSTSGSSSFLGNKSTTGNYWYIYTGIDANNDQIGDTVFTFGSSVDNYPQMDKETGYVLNQFGNPISGSLVYQNASNINIYPIITSNAADIADTYIDSTNPTTNYGTSTHLLVDNTVIPSNIDASLLEFDFSSIPVTSVSSAIFNIYLDASNVPQNIHVFRITSSWTELGVTYNTFPNVGAQEGSFVSGSPQFNSWKTVNLTNVVNGWLNGSITNNGVMLISDQYTSSQALFESRENSQKPYISITYTCTTCPQTGSKRNSTTDTNGFYSLSTIGRNTINLNTSFMGIYQEKAFSFGTNNDNFTFYNAPAITNWNNTKTKNSDLEFNIGLGTTIGFNVSANQTITTWVWSIDGVNQNVNFSNFSTSFGSQATHNIAAAGINSNGTTNNIIWTVHALTNVYDPSGYVKDIAGNPLFNAKVVLNNATFTATTAYSDTTGYWATNIFADGVYTFTVTKAGYVTNTSTQTFTTGGTNNNFTLTPAQGLIFGRIFTTINSTGSTPVKADLDQIKSQLTDKTVSTGSTITLLDSPDGHTYVIKLIDQDSSTQTAIIQILKDGSVIDNGDQLNLNQLFQFKIRETAFSTTFIEITLNNVFQGTELGTININAGFNNYKKTGTNLIQFLGDIVFGIGGVLINPFNWDGFTTDGSNTLPVTFNASTGKDAIGSQVFDAGSSGNIFNFYTVLNAQSTSSNSGKVLLGYTDDNILTAPAFTDTLFINSRNIYRGTTEDFKSLDADGDGKIRVWFDFVSGYSSFNIYEFYVNMLGATTLKPLIGANVYFNVTVNTRSTSPNGNYSLFVPFGTDTINYYLTGFESKNITYTFNSTNENLQQDIILNATNRTFNSTEEYVFVLPNPSLTTDQLHAFFRTLDHTNPLLLGSGDYQIAVCPLINGGVDCTKYDVDANTESSISIANPGLGEYTISLTGYLGGFLDFERDIIVSNNFTVLSSTPTVKWDSPIHYLDEAMILTIYVPSGSAFVNVSYPNGTILYSNSFSAATTLYNVSFQTNSNLSINAFPPGTYKAVISGGNTDFTELKNISAGSYSVSAPSSVVWGSTFTISYQSPRTSTLYITDSNNDVLLSEDVPPQGGTTGTEQFDTATLENKDTVLTIQLIRGGVSVANTTVSVTHSEGGAGTPGSGGQATQALGDNLTRFIAMPAFWGMIFFILGVYAVASNKSASNSTGIVAFILANVLAVIGMWSPFTIYVLVIVWMIAGMNFYVGRKASHPD